MLRKALVVGSMAACLVTSSAFAEMFKVVSTDGQRAVYAEKTLVHDLGSNTDKEVLVFMEGSSGFVLGDAIRGKGWSYSLPVGQQHVGLAGLQGTDVTTFAFTFAGYDGARPFVKDVEHNARVN